MIQKHFDLHYINDFANRSVYFQWKQILFAFQALQNPLCFDLFHFQKKTTLKRIV